MAEPRIAVIGWGSLIWDLDNLTPHVTGAWGIGSGPALPLEFTRISPKRKMALTVVIDRAHGADCPTSHITSTRREIEAAVADLAARERVPAHRIGWVDTQRDDGFGPDPVTLAEVGLWCRDNGMSGAVWTELPANFTEVTRQPFGFDNALSYLKTLDEASLVEAKRYIEEAPRTTVTPLRSALSQDPWWLSLAYD
ncbi:MAG: hypothetical protein MRY63_10530 [Neomegalonema sp.]|nr:hypothetical protein [Neomegalonema sp.]